MTHPGPRRPKGSPPPSVPITKGQKVVKGSTPPSTGSGSGSGTSGCSLWTFAPPVGAFLLALSTLVLAWR